MTLRSVTVLAGLAILSGCATPSVHLPAKMAAPDSWRTSPAMPRTSEPSGESAPWWGQLADPVLDQFIALALAENTDIRIASARIQQARSQMAGSVAEQRPNLGSNLDARRERVPRGRIRWQDGVTVKVPPYLRSQILYQAVEASYEIDLLGRLSLAVQAAESELLATEADRRAVRLWVAHEVVVAYTDARLAERLLPHANRAFELFTALLNAERSKRAAGLSTLAAVHSIEDELAGVREALADLERSRSLGLARLALVLGKAPSELAWSPADAPAAQLPDIGVIDADLPTAVLDRRPDVDAAWRRVVASTTDAERIRLEKYPKFTLTSGVGLFGTLRTWLTGEALGWAIGAAIQGPLLDGGRVKARTDVASAIAVERYMEYRKVVLQVLNEVESALTEAAYTQEQLRIAESATNRRAADTIAVSNLMHQGMSGRLAFLRAELARIDAIQLETVRRHNLILAWASVQKTLGR